MQLCQEIVIVQVYRHGQLVTGTNKVTGLQGAGNPGRKAQELESGGEGKLWLMTLVLMS